MTQNNQTDTPLFKVSIWISYLFHPLLMPTLIIAIMLFGIKGIYLVNPDGKFWFLGLTIFYTLVLPGGGAYLLKRGGLIRSLHLASKTERTLPLLFSMIIYAGFSFFFLAKLQVAELLMVVLGSITLTITLNFIINLFFKISSHSIGAGGLLGATLAFAYQNPTNSLLWLVVLSIIVCGLVISSRLYLKAHSTIQVIAGFFVGLFVLFGGIFMLG